MHRIMFVCHGNICRSPMAEFILKDLVKKQNCEKDFLIMSSATSTEEIINGIGNPIYPPARAELKKHGILSDGKYAVQLKKSDYDKYDLFICMDDLNIRNALKIFNINSCEKVRKLMSYTSENRDVADPWYTGDFDVTYNDIYNGCIALLNSFI